MAPAAATLFLAALAPLTLLAPAGARRAHRRRTAAPSELGPSPTGLYDCRVVEELGCFRGTTGRGDAFPFSGGTFFERTMNRDRSPNLASGNAPGRCAEFCATHYFQLSALSVIGGSDACMCGNSTAVSGARVAGGKCATTPPAPSEYNLTTRKYAAPACLSGTASCACSGNTSAACGNPGVARVFRHSCAPGSGPGRYLCPLIGGRYLENGSTVSYQAYMDCFGQASLEGQPWLGVAPLLGGQAYPDAGVSMRPELGLLCNMTKDLTGWYCRQAVEVLRRYTQNPRPPGAQYHSYETLLAFQSVRDAGLPNAGLNASELAAFHGRILKEVPMPHQPKVENHGLDVASQETLAPLVFPNLSWPDMTTIPEGVIANWLHGHAVDEYAIGYDSITLNRLLQVLELSGGEAAADLHSDACRRLRCTTIAISTAYKQFVQSYADVITPAGCFANHGGGLQDDGSEYTTRRSDPFTRETIGMCSGDPAFAYFFEFAATKFQKLDPQAAATFKWAARSFWRANIATYADFSWAPVRTYLEEQKQLRAGGGVPIEVPELVDIRSKVVLKNEYQQDATRTNGSLIPKAVVLCPSRQVGSPYLQSDIYPTPPGYHGNGMQAGTMSHFEVGEHLFLYGGSQTKHTSQSDADTGLPILMPFSEAADGRFPWRWGQMNMAPGKWQRADLNTLWLSGSTQATGNWNDYQSVTVSSTGTPKTGRGTDNLGFSCSNDREKPFFILLGNISLVAENGTELILDNFSYANASDRAPWGPGTSWSFPDGVDRPPVLRMECQPGASLTRPAATRPHGLPGAASGIRFDHDDFPWIRYRWMIDPSWEINMTKGFDPQSGGYGSSSYLNQGIPLHFTPTQFVIAPSSDFIALFRNVTASNNAHNDSGGGWRTMGYGGWTRETEWTRHMVLTVEGALIVADSLKTSEMEGGWLGGPLWQINVASNCTSTCLAHHNCSKRWDPSSTSAATPTPDQCNRTRVEPEGDWFDLSGFDITTSPIDRYRGLLPKRLNLVAKMGNAQPALGRKHGVTPGWMAMDNCPDASPTGCGWREPGFGNATRHPQPWPGFPWQTLWSKQKIAENSRALFVSVFAPYKTSAGKSAAQALARSIAIDVAADSASARVKLTPYGSAQELTVDLDIYGRWSVARAGQR